MGARKDAVLMDGNEQRTAMLSGIKDKTAVQLYDEAMAQLETRGQATFTAALQLRDAAQWTVTINDMQQALSSALRSFDPDDKKISLLIKYKQAAEDARRRILDGLLLTPQKQRGRPPKAERPAQEELPEDDGWDDFGKSVRPSAFAEPVSATGGGSLNAGDFESDDGS